MSDEAVDALEAEDNKLVCELAELEEREGEFTSAQMQVSGAIVYVNHNGGLTVHRGLVHREDREEACTMMQDSGTELPRSLTKKEKGVHSEKLLLNLTAHRTAAVQSALAMNPNVAFVTIVHKLALDFLYNSYIDGASVVQVSSREAIHDMDRAAPNWSRTNTRPDCVNMSRRDASSCLPIRTSFTGGSWSSRKTIF